MAKKSDKAPIGSSVQGRFLAKGGQAKAAIVVGRDSSSFYRWVAGEVRRYLRGMTGAELPIVASDRVPADKPLVVLGSPKSNPLAAAAEKKQFVSFNCLKQDGFVIKTINDLEGRPVLLAGGNDEASTMYAAYDLLERLGIVFQLTGDIIPQRKPDLALPELDVRMEPMLSYRGMHCCHGLRWYMGLEDFRKHINQLAKLKLNCLQFYFGMGAPWIEFSYGGKAAEIIYPKESGYVAWGFGLSTSGTAKEVWVGRECFPSEYLGPPEFAEVQTPEEAHRTARDFLSEIIRYAHQRNVQVWLTMGEIPYVPPNLVPPAAKRLHNFYCGTAIPMGDPALLDIWEAAVRSMIETYPDADSYGIWMSEHSLPADDPQTQILLREYAAVRKLIPPAEEIHRQGSVHPLSPQALDSDLGEIAIVDRLIRRIKARHPTAKLGVILLFRGYLLRPMDFLLPKDVWIMNMENFLNTGPVMHFYGGMTSRELLAMPRIDDDGCELHVQLNAMLYDRDEIIPGSAWYGLAGIVGQLNKERGLECNVRYVAEGAWNRQIQCRSFYEDYLRRLYGPEPLDTLLKAYLMLEENEKTLGWQGRRGIFPGYTRFSPCKLRTNVNYRERQPKLDCQQLQRDIQAAEEARKFWQGRAAHCRQALELLREARSKVLPGSQAELDYVIFKTENIISYFEVLNACQEAKSAFDRALLAIGTADTTEFRKQLRGCQAALDRAGRMAWDATGQMIAYAYVPTEKYLLFRYNQNVIGSIESAQTYLAEVIAFHERKNRRDSLACHERCSVRLSRNHTGPWVKPSCASKSSIPYD